jgi:hypothetical protein
VLRQSDATRSTRSVLVVSFHLDGLLRSRPPACRSWHQIWGSPGWSYVDRCNSPTSRSSSCSDRARDAPVRDALRRFAPRRQPIRITAVCSPRVVHRLLRMLSPPISASFRADLGPWAVCSAPSPSSMAFLPRPADGPEDFPLGCARCLPSPVARRREVGHTRLRVESRPTAYPFGSARADDADPRSRTRRGVVRPVGSLRHGLIETGALLLRFPPSRAGGWLESPRSNEISRTARPPFSSKVPCGSFVSDGALVLRWLFRSTVGPLVPLPSRSLPHRPSLALCAGDRPTPGSCSIDESSEIRTCVATSGLPVPSLGLLPLRGFRPALARHP